MRGPLDIRQNLERLAHREVPRGYARPLVAMTISLTLVIAIGVVWWEVHTGHWRSLKPILDSLHIPT